MYLCASKMISITGSQIILSDYYKHTCRNNKQLIIWVASATTINNIIVRIKFKEGYGFAASNLFAY